MNDEILEAEIIDPPSVELEVRPQANLNLFGTSEPADVVARATEVADILARVLRDKSLISTIQGREHVKVEGWTLCGSMLGVFAILDWSRRVAGTPETEGWEARVTARTLSGDVIGAAEAQCLRSENQWSLHPKGRDGKVLQARDDYALRSMAQTRATSKALRQPLGFIVQLAGFDPTPAEEMPAERRPRGRPRDGETYAAENQVTGLLELAARVSDDAHTKAVASVAKHREAHDGRVQTAWLVRQQDNLLQKLPEGVEPPAESQFKAPTPPEPDIPF